jgi:hypothetical protein
METTTKPVPENIQAIVTEVNVNACHNSVYQVEAYLYKEARTAIGGRHDDWRLLIRNRKTKAVVVHNLQWEHAHWHTYAVMMNGFNSEIEQREKEAQFEAIRNLSSLMVKSLGLNTREYDQYVRKELSK